MVFCVPGFPVTLLANMKASQCPNGPFAFWGLTETTKQLTVWRSAEVDLLILAVHYERPQCSLLVVHFFDSQTFFGVNRPNSTKATLRRVPHLKRNQHTLLVKRSVCFFSPQRTDTYGAKTTPVYPSALCLSQTQI